MKFSELSLLYRQTLLENVIPFWMRFAIDPDGGINTCITDAGQVVSRDRWGWSQWRAVWVFSKLYNQIASRPAWLDVAKGICGFMRVHGPLENGHWPLLLDGDGRVLRGYESVYTDGFAIYGLVELWRATQDAKLLDLAMQTFRATAMDTPAYIRSSKNWNRIGTRIQSALKKSRNSTIKSFFMAMYP